VVAKGHSAGEAVVRELQQMLAPGENTGPKP
jgi:hypothetical protein